MIIHQILPNMEYGDAISNYAILLRRIIRSWGARSNIYAQFVHPNFSRVARLAHFFPRDLPETAVTIYHYSIGSEVTPLVRSLPGRKILIYHNITPPNFSLTGGGSLASRFYAGLEELKTFTDVPDIAVGDSEFNRQALINYGFTRTDVMPLVIDYNAFERRPERRLMRELDDGAVNFITVGRIYPHKKIEDVIAAFIFYKRYVNERSRLFIIGDPQGMEDYFSRLQTIVQNHGTQDIVFTQKVRFRELLAYYQRAHVYLCMSEHEGFCVPLLECMYLGVPIIAYNKTAVSETMGEAGVLVNEKDFAHIAEMANLMIRDEDFRTRVINRQKDRVLDFQIESLDTRLRRVLAQVTAV